MKVAFIGAFEKEKDLGCPHWIGIRQACEILEVNCYFGDIRIYDEDKLLEDLREFKPDVVVHCLLDSLQSHFCLKVREIKSVKVNALYYVDLALPSADDYGIDICFLGNKDYIEIFKQKYGAKEAYFVPQAYYLQKRRLVDPNEHHHMVFIGNDKHPKRRAELINRLKRYVNIDILNETDWNKRAQIYHRMPKIYGSSNFSLSISACNHLACYTSNRLYCIVGAGGFAIAEYFKECEELFEDSKHLVYFKSPEEFHDLVRYYIAYPQKRAKIARQGHQHQKKHHTYINRIRDILAYVKKFMRQ